MTTKLTIYPIFADIKPTLITNNASKPKWHIFSNISKRLKEDARRLAYGQPALQPSDDEN
jgi:hypothetical protein